MSTGLREQERAGEVCLAAAIINVFHKKMFLQSSQTNIFTTQTSSMSLAELCVDQDPIEGCFEG